MNIETREFRLGSVLSSFFKKGFGWISGILDQTVSPLGAESKGGLVERIQHKAQPDKETERDAKLKAKFIFFQAP